MAEKATFLISWAWGHKPKLPTRYLYGKHSHFASYSIIIVLIQKQDFNLAANSIKAQSFSKINASVRFAEFVPCLPVPLRTIIFLQKDILFPQEIWRVMLVNSHNPKISVPVSPLHQHLQIWRSEVACPIKFMQLETKFGQENRDQLGSIINNYNVWKVVPLLIVTGVLKN